MTAPPESTAGVGFGAIADDFTGAADLASLIRRRGLSVSLLVGVPEGLQKPETEAVVVALKTRTSEPDVAVAQSLQTARWLCDTAKAKTIYFKYCSTFDSTDRGNIGPVIDALMDELRVERTVAVPAFPENGRRVFMGHLFVGDRMLSESSMAAHPLTPMRDADIVRVLSRQRRGPVRLVEHARIEHGRSAIDAAFHDVSPDTVLICDTIADRDIERLADAFATLPLTTGGSPFGAAIAAHVIIDQATAETRAFPRPAPRARYLALSGSGSEATRRQVAEALAGGFFGVRVTADEATDPQGLSTSVLARLDASQADRCLVYATDTTEEVAKTQQRLGRERAGAALEQFFGALAVAARARGYTSFIVAGGETSGEVVRALGANALLVGPEIAPGVPWLNSGDVWIAPKSGNFGGPRFFDDARRVLAGDADRP